MIVLIGIFLFIFSCESFQDREIQHQDYQEVLLDSCQNVYITPQGDLANGTVVTYYPNRQKRCSKSFKDGLKHGQCTGWYSSGNIRYKGTYFEGVREGEWLSWHDKIMRDENYSVKYEDGKIINQGHLFCDNCLKGCKRSEFEHFGSVHSRYCGCLMHEEIEKKVCIFERKHLRNISEIEKEVQRQIDRDVKKLINENSLPSRFNQDFKIFVTTDLNVSSSTTMDLTTYYNYKVTESSEVIYVGEAFDYPTGVYDIENSRAARLLSVAVKRSIDNYLNVYLERGSKVIVELTGYTDGAPVSSFIPYNNEYGNFPNSNISFYFLNNRKKSITLNGGDAIDNPEIGFLRTYGVRDFIERKISLLNNENTEFTHYAYTETDRNKIGGQFRKVNIKIKIFDLPRSLL